MDRIKSPHRDILADLQRGQRAHAAEIVLLKNAATRDPDSATTLPSVAYDGQVIRYKADATTGVNWRFVYDSSQATYKWLFDGGSPLYSEIDTTEANPSVVVYTNLATVGPSIVVPRAGQYKLEYGGRIYIPSANGQGGWISPKLGSAATSDNDAADFYSPGVGAGTLWASVARKRVRTLAAGDTVLLQYRSDAANAFPQFSFRWLNVTPIRVI